SPESVEKYLGDAARLNKNSTEEEVQNWFNGLMGVVSPLWGSVAAGDTHNIPYLDDLKPDISVSSKDIVKGGAYILKYVFTVLEIKCQKNISGLADEDKGQLSGYIRVQVQQQPSRRFFAAFLSDG
ncbi:20081_t:CDS:1, partial [Dentiscutata erythropus]